jgi:hypothetical protein
MPGGRPKGSLNKRTHELIAAVTEGGETPLDYMLRVMRDPAVDHERRDRNAAQAAPYVHPKLAQIDSNAKVNLDGSVTFTWPKPQE